MKELKEYKCIYICEEAEDTENKLNVYASKGWKLICAYSKNNNYLIMERDRQ